MKRFPKLLATLLLLAMVIGIFAAMPVAAADYQAMKLTTSMLEIGHYTTLAMNGEIVHYTPATDYEHEIGCIIDNSNKGGYWSSGYKYSSLKDNGGTTVPVIMIDLSLDGEPDTIHGYAMRLRDYFDCEPLHFEVQAIVEKDSKNWVSVIDRKVSVDEWSASPTLQFIFPSAVTAYKVRILIYDIGEPNIARDNGYDKYPNLLGDETRFTLAEIDLLQEKSGSGSSGSGSTTKPTTGGSQVTTRPNVQVPTRPGTQTTTQAPTQPATKAPSQTTTVAPTQPATKAPSQTTTVAPTTAPGQTATVAPTQPATQDGTVAPTEDATIDPSAPIVDPSAPTDVTEPEATVEATEPEATTGATEPEATTGATEPEATTGSTDNGTTEEPKDFTAVIIIAIVAALAVAGGAVFFIIKKKRG